MAVNSCHSTIAGGKGNIIKFGSNSSSGAGATGSFIGGGFTNIITGSLNSFNSIVGGRENIISSSCGGFIGGGFGNQLEGANFSFVGIGSTKGGGIFKSGCSAIVNSAGASAICNSNFSFIGGGNDLEVLASSTTNIVGGQDHCIISQSYSSIVGGFCNQIRSTLAEGITCNNFIGGGRCNTINTSCNSSILGGICNTVEDFSNSHIIGSSISAGQSNTTYMNNTIITGSLTVGKQDISLSSTVGRIDATNDVVAFSTSDRRLKENIQPINGALCKVIGVSGNTFDWKELNQEEIKTIHGNTGKDVGVIAQEIEEILPEAVTTRDNGYKAVNYEKIVPLLIEAIKEQQKQIDELKSKV